MNLAVALEPWVLLLVSLGVTALIVVGVVTARVQATGRRPPARPHAPRKD